MLTTTKQRECRTCGSTFAPWSTTQTVCGRICAAKLVKEERKAEKAQDKANREKLKSRAKWLAECQAIVNKIVRLTALARGDGCFTCGATPEQKFGGTYDAGHFRSVGSAPHLRFWMPQIKLQCIPCNRHKGGMALLFRQGLLREHGPEWVEALEARQEIAKFDIPYLARFKKVMGRKLKRLEKRCNAA